MPKSDWFEAMRLRIWCEEIDRRREGRTNYVLSSAATRLIGGSQTGTDRLRVFESAFQGHLPRVPVKGLPFEQLAERIPGLEGTAEYFSSPVWPLLAPGKLSAVHVSAMADKELQRRGLRRFLPDSFWATESHTMFAEHYRTSLNVALALQTDVGRLSLLAVLCVEACSVGTSSLADDLREQFDRALQGTDFGQRITAPFGDGPYLEVIDAICYPQMGIPVSGDQRSAIEQKVQRLIIIDLDVDDAMPTTL